LKSDEEIIRFVIKYSGSCRQIKVFLAFLIHFEASLDKWSVWKWTVGASSWRKCLCTEFQHHWFFGIDGWRCTLSYLSSFLSTYASSSSRGRDAEKCTLIHKCTLKDVRWNSCKSKSSIIYSSPVYAATRAPHEQTHNPVLFISSHKLFLQAKTCRALSLLLPSTCFGSVQLKPPD
jgi:hypothetical protein